MKNCIRRSKQRFSGWFSGNFINYIYNFFYFRLKSIKKEIVRSERAFAARAQRKLLKEEATKDLPKRLGPHKFKDPDLEVKLSDEIEGSLRKLKPEGSLLDDRLKSFQKRNIIEPRKKAKSKRRYALKKQVKRRFKAPV
ncbi:hypothetical protein CAPTEDRAFT_89666 [Capitella teleta]|uniref:Ribosome biogenesis protein NOP53 n=1 Tax=Capitella teleta TaxID=283909 RepID=R7TTZ8_CAPTE|nr:hypothetical protein CAPTEDRAFT_89666 [Capitella teleta]|eukprot:ELT97368.1 hypothetical protein CAPTEDRAFT_89666 [Capitella teleta]